MAVDGCHCIMMIDIATFFISDPDSCMALCEAVPSINQPRQHPNNGLLIIMVNNEYRA